MLLTVQYMMQESSPSPSALQATPLFSANLPGRRSLAATLATSPAARLDAVLGDLGKRSQARLDLDASNTQSMTAAVGGGVTVSTAGLGGHGAGTTGIVPGHNHHGLANVYIPGAPAESASGSRAVSPGGSHISGLASATVGGPPVSVGLAYGVAAPASTAVSEMDAGDVDEARQDMQVQYFVPQPTYVLFFLLFHSTVRGMRPCWSRHCGITLEDFRCLHVRQQCGTCVVLGGLRIDG